MSDQFENIELRVPEQRFENWADFVARAPEYSIGLEVMDDTPGHRGHYVHFDHHAGVIREATMSAAMQAYIAVRQGRLMERWLRKRRPLPVYVWNADQDVCLAAFVLEYHQLLERAEGTPTLRWIVQYNNKIDVCGGLYPVNLNELVKNHFTWVFEPYREQRRRGKMFGDAGLIRSTIRSVCDRLLALLQGQAGFTPITAEPEILYTSPYNFVIADEKGDPLSRLVLAAQGHTNLISLVCCRPSGRFTYSIIRGSSYDEDIFQVTKLIDALQAAEDRSDVRIWGGSNLAAGSDSELGSSLHWTQVRDIAEKIVREAYLKGAGVPVLARVADPKAPPRVLLAMTPDLRQRLYHYLDASDVEVIPADTCAEACRVLDEAGSIDAIVTCLSLPDGDYSRLLTEVKGRGEYVPTVVCLRQTDGGCADLLERGAFRLLADPCRPELVLETISEAVAERRRPW